MKVDYVVDPVPVPVPVPFSDALHVADFPLRSMKQQILVLRRRTTRIQKVKVVIFQRLDVAFLTLRLTNQLILNRYIKKRERILSLRLTKTFTRKMTKIAIIFISFNLRHILKLALSALFLSMVIATTKYDVTN